MSAIERFWAWFQGRETALRRISSHNDPLLEEAYQEHLNISDGLAIEIAGENGGGPEVVIGAGGNKASFDLVDRIVEAAPALANWKVVALKPALGFDFASDCEGRVYAPVEMTFVFLRPPAPDRGARLKIYVPGLPKNEVENAEFILWRILDTALGERSCALDVEAIQVEPMPRTPPPGAQPLPVLPRHLLNRG